MKYTVVTRRSVALNIVFICGMLLFSNKSYSMFQQKLSPGKDVEIREESLKETTPQIIYYSASNFDIIGQIPDTEIFSRLPEKARNKVRQAVWNLSKNSAGISIRFTSNATSIKLRWILKKNTDASNMTPIASKGFDLYAYRNNKWQFAGVAKPQNSVTNEATIIEGMEKETREYLLNLPLYDGIDSLEIGIDSDVFIKKPVRQIIDTSNSIIFYGTSITQGASASRPGLTYPALIQRALNKEVINLGFSGNGRFEKEVAEYFMTANPSVILLDCTPNSSAEIIRENLPELIKYIRSVNDSVPVVFVESIIRDYAYFKKDVKSNFGTLSFIGEQNKALQDVYRSSSAIYKNLYYIDSENLIGNDNEATVDGTHFNDLGHFRAYEQLYQYIKKIINL